MTYRPPQCSEREPDGAWEDCTWASLVMLGNAAYASAHYPSTQAEYEALRRASGDTMTGGSNLDDGVKGMDKRWGWHGTMMSDSLFALNALKVGQGVALQGRMSEVSVHLRRWDPKFIGAHCAYVQREANGYWWMNPEAPLSYAGEFVLLAELRAYAKGLGGSKGMVVTIGQRAAFKPQIWFSTGAFWVYQTDGKPFTDSRGVKYGGTILDRDRKRFSAPTGPKPCSAALPYAWPGFGTRRIVKVGGSMNGALVGTASPAVTIKEVAA
jgi:hypothetical protein